MGSECTVFQMLDDHVTQPVFFIPQTHVSSLQRMVGHPHVVLARVLAALCQIILASLSLSLR